MLVFKIFETNKRQQRRAAGRRQDQVEEDHDDHTYGTGMY
jgi:hypothetical protein